MATLQWAVWAYPWASGSLAAFDLLNPAVVVITPVLLFFYRELEEHAAGVLRMDVRLPPAVAALHPAERLDPERPNRLRGAVDILDLERYVMQPRPLVLQESMQVALLV